MNINKKFSPFLKSYLKLLPEDQTKIDVILQMLRREMDYLLRVSAKERKRRKGGNRLISIRQQLRQELKE